MLKLFLSANEHDLTVSKSSSTCVDSNVFSKHLLLAHHCLHCIVASGVTLAGTGRGEKNTPLPRPLRQNMLAKFGLRQLIVQIKFNTNLQAVLAQQAD